MSRRRQERAALRELQRKVWGDRCYDHHLAELARGRQRRISIIATHQFIRIGEFADTLRIAESLLDDEEDLIHKAAGWMLREVGKRDLVILVQFLKQHAHVMPRTMLRYAIERFPEDKRQSILRGELKAR